MITAAQAKEKTMERIAQVAREFITNEVDTAVDKAISFGRFNCTVNLKGIVNPKATGAEVVNQLQALGFETQHISSALDSEGYIDIKWENLRCIKMD